MEENEAQTPESTLPATDLAEPGPPSLKPKADEVFRGMWASLFFSGQS